MFFICNTSAREVEIAKKVQYDNEFNLTIVAVNILY